MFPWYFLCLLILFEVATQEAIAYTNNFETPSLLIQENYLSNISISTYKERHSEYGKVSTKKYLPSTFLKGYSLKTAVFKSFGNASRPNFRQLGLETRAKRGVGHLYNMISCATGCDPLSYKGYGCFCGLFGAGYPVDGIDRCCKTHDWCYDAANCPMYLEYFIPYYWKCWYKMPFCASDHAELGAPGSCADKLCECDKVLSVCLKKYSCPSRRAVCRHSPLRFLQNAFKLFT